MTPDVSTSPVCGSCPDHSRLACFCAGKLGDHEFASIASHLDGCDECSRWVQGHTNDDTVAANLRQPDPLQRYASEPAIAAIKARGAGAAGVTGDRDASQGLTAGDESAAPRGPSTYRKTLNPAMTRLPTRLGPYRIVESIGQGGMGEVFKAIDEALNCTVAVKVLHVHRVSEERFVSRFSQEMRAIGSLDHPNIVRARAAGEYDGLMCLVMDYVEGMDLKLLLRRSDVIAVNECCAIIAQAALGLQCIHEHGLVHRDIKPSNLMLDRHGTVKILDLGLAQWQQEDWSSLTASRDLLGTIDYMAPEQADDPRQTDIRADIYSLGCTMYELLTGRPPFSGEGCTTLRQKLQAHHEQDAPSIRSLVPRAPQALDAIVRRALAKRPQDRFSTPMELRNALLKLSTEANLSSLLLRPSVRSPGHARLVPNRRRWMLWTFSAIVAAIAGAVGWLRDLFRKPAPINNEPAWSRQLAITNPPGSTTRASCVWDDRNRAAVVSTHDWCLVSAADSSEPDYRFTIEFEMPGSDGQCGIFVGYRLVQVDGRQCPAFQFIELVMDTPLQWRLTRRFVFLDRPSKLMPLPSSVDAKGTGDEYSASVSGPRSGQPNVLDVRVTPSGLTELNWNGAPVPQLTGDEANRQFRQEHYIGLRGIATKNTMWIKRVDGLIESE